MVPDHSNASKSEVVRYRWGLSQTVSLPGCLRDPIVFSYVFLAPDSRPPYCYVCKRCTRRIPSPFPLDLPLGHAASAEPPPIERKCHANSSGFPPDSNTIYLSALYRPAVLPSYDLSHTPVRKTEACSGIMAPQDNNSTYKSDSDPVRLQSRTRSADLVT